MKMPSLNEQWEQVKVFYERTTPFRFCSRPTNEKVVELFLQMKKLQATMKEFYFQKPHLKERFSSLERKAIQKRKSYE